MARNKTSVAAESGDTTISNATAQASATVKKKAWNYQPGLPIALSPYFDFPPNPKAMWRWFIGTWFKITPPVNHLFFALLAYAYFWPPVSAMQQPHWHWMLQIWMVNMAAILILAAPLHLYLYTFSGQQLHLKFDARPMQRSARFTFGDQVRDNIFWTLVFGVPIWSVWMAVYFYFAANGWVPVIQSFKESPILFLLLFFVIRFWQSFHFYWIHRLIHIPWMYKRVHHVHHRNINVGPWSGLSMHPAEHVLYYSSILIHFVLPSHPVHVIFHMFALSLGAVLSHSGFDKIVIKNRETLKAGAYFHQLHHRYFECNYGSEETPVDRWCGTFHDGTGYTKKRDANKRFGTRK